MRDSGLEDLESFLEVNLDEISPLAENLNAARRNFASAMRRGEGDVAGRYSKISYDLYRRILEEPADAKEGLFIAWLNFYCAAIEKGKYSVAGKTLEDLRYFRDLFGRDVLDIWNVNLSDAEEIRIAASYSKGDSKYYDEEDFQ